jgi:hypothetical protein
MGYALNRAIVKRIRCHDSGKEISKFFSFSIAFLNAIMNCLKLG